MRSEGNLKVILEIDELSSLGPILAGSLPSITICPPSPGINTHSPINIDLPLPMHTSPPLHSYAPTTPYSGNRGK